MGTRGIVALKAEAVAASEDASGVGTAPGMSCGDARCAGGRSVGFSACAISACASATAADVGGTGRASIARVDVIAGNFEGSADSSPLEKSIGGGAGLSTGGAAGS